ncbi:MAG: DMT family transporter [Candidatus Paceibacterota bacterium]
MLAAIGFLNVLVLWFYLLALQDEEASIAIVFYQLVPVIALVLGYYILDEVITKIELIGMAIVILGTSIIAFEIDAENNFKLKGKTAIYMTLASFFWALESVIFKAVALEENVWRSLFWEHVMLVLVGIVIFIFVRSYRENFLLAIKTNSKAILGLNVANESLYMSGNILFAFAYLWAPIALILLLNSFQPIFVLAIGIFLTIFFPKITAEKIHATNLWQKIIAIIITGIGTYLLLM